MRQRTIFFLVAAFIVVFGITFAADQIYAPSDTSATPDTALATYSLEEIASHADTSSCWAVVRGHVYDLTSWIDKHPGGKEAILSICGKDATAAFEMQHGGQREPENELKNFHIGELLKA